MRIDWFTVGAQVLNFLILVWVLKRFLYKPILHALDAREKRIATTLADADAKMSEAEQKRTEFQQKNEAFDQQRDERLNQVKDEANAERHRLLDAARQAAEDLRGKRQEALQREHQTLRDAIARRTSQEVFAIARKALGDLAGASLEARMIAVFTRRVRELDDATKSTLGQALAAAPAVVRSAFDLPGEQREAIQRAVNETFSADIKLSFETAPDVVSGIELTAAGQKVAWSIADYLKTLEKGVSDVLTVRLS